MRKRLYVSTKGIEIDKPSGGGHGPDALYSITVSIDGRPALYLQRDNFKEPGQMHAFAEIMEEYSARDITETVP